VNDRKIKDAHFEYQIKPIEFSIFSSQTAHNKKIFLIFLHFEVLKVTFPFDKCNAMENQCSKQRFINVFSFYPNPHCFKAITKVTASG
jgi:hypothetical protein